MDESAAMKFKVPLYFYFLTQLTHASSVEVWAHFNSSTLLPCSTSFSFSGNEDWQKTNVSLLGVSWVHNQSVIAASGTHGNYTEEGFILDPRTFANGTFSLILQNTSVSQQGHFECSVSYNYTKIYSSCVTVYIIAPPSLSIPSTMVVINRESEIECHADGFTPALISFSWIRDGTVMRALQSFTAVNRSSNGYFSAVNSLVLTPTEQDKGINFSCVVNHISLQQPLTLEFWLNLTYLPTVTLSVLPSAAYSPYFTLSCDIEGFYPEEITVSWLQNGLVLPASPSVQPGPGGLFRTRHYHTFNIEENQRAGDVQCVVQQAAVPQLVSETVNLSAADSQVHNSVLTKSAKASVALMAMSLILVLLLCFGSSWRRREEKQKSLTVSGVILPPRITVGKKGRVTVCVEGRRVDRVQAVWFINDRPISDNSHGTENDPLLPLGGKRQYYKLHTQRPLQSANSKTKQLISALTFVPSISDHQGAVFKCQVSYRDKDKVVVEKVSDKLTLLAAPEVSEIQLSEPDDGSGVITLTAQASRFHPDIIMFRWFCQGGELSPVESTQSLSGPQSDSQGFFSAASQCKLPRVELEKGETMAWVKVYHMALKKPIIRETKGFIKKPQISDISCFSTSTTAPDQLLTLGCEITGFYPPQITVTWRRLGGGGSEDEEIIKGTEIWGPLLTHPGTYRISATLREGMSKPVAEENERTMVCRVMHISLQEPIEKHWRHCNIAPPFIPSSLSVEWDNDGIGVFSLKLLDGHPRARLLWAAGGATLSPLISRENEGEGENGIRELLSVCTLKRCTLKDTGGKTNTVIKDCETTEIEIMSEKEDRDMKRPQQCPGTPIASLTRKEGIDKYGGGEEEKDFPSQLNTHMRTEGRPEEREQLRVSVEITHPALPLPVYRTWIEPWEELAS